MFRLLTHNISSSYSCNYSFWHWPTGSTTHLVVPDSCVCSIVFFWCFWFGKALLPVWCQWILYTWVRASWIELNECPTRCDLFSLLHFCIQLYMFRLLTHITSSWYSCNYSFWHWSAGSTICLVVPDSCVCYIKFSFDVFDLIKLFCLFGINEFYIHGSVYREPHWIIVQQDGTYSVYYISVYSSTCFGCWPPSPGAGTAVITASGTGQLGLLYVWLYQIAAFVI